MNSACSCFTLSPRHSRAPAIRCLGRRAPPQRSHRPRAGSDPVRSSCPRPRGKRGVSWRGTWLVRCRRPCCGARLSYDDLCALRTTPMDAAAVRGAVAAILINVCSMPTGTPARSPRGFCSRTCGIGRRPAMGQRQRKPGRDRDGFACGSWARRIARRHSGSRIADLFVYTSSNGVRPARRRGNQENGTGRSRRQTTRIFRAERSFPMSMFRNAPGM